MGYGDHLMAAGLAEDLYRTDPSAGPVTICDCQGVPRVQPLWEGNPAIGVSTTTPPRTIRCGGGCLPYLDYPRLDHPPRLRFSATYRAADHRGHLYLTDAEQAVAADLARRYGDYLVIEPTPQDRKNLNRCWPLSYWADLVSQLQRHTTYALLQCAHPASNLLPGVPAIPTLTFRDACAVFVRARLVIALEGGVPFATAALGVPTLVLWGGCVSAPTLSYPEHANLVDDQPDTPCGMLVPCEHCRRAWQRLTPDYVDQTVRQSLREPVYGTA